MKAALFIKKETAVALLFLTPSVGGFALFYAIPFVMGLFYSFLDSPIDGAFVGLQLQGLVCKLFISQGGREHYSFYKH